MNVPPASDQHIRAMDSTSQAIGSRRVELAFDIYVLIIDLVTNKYPQPEKDLKALSLTHRSLVAPCQKRLFHSVTYSDKVARKLLDIHDASPHLADYVRHLYLSTDHRADKTRPNEVMAAFLSKFRNLSGLELDFRVSETSQLQYEWKNLDPAVATALLALLSSQSRLETLAMYMIKGFPSKGILNLAKYREHLKDFTMYSVTVDFTNIVTATDLEASDSVAPGPGRLVKCTFGAETRRALSILTGSPESPAKNRPVLDFSSTENLLVEWKNQDDLAGTKLLMQSSPHLRKLHVELPKGSRMTFRGLSTAILGGPSKEIKELWLSCTEPEENKDDPLYGVCRELKRLSGNVNALDHLDIFLNIYCSEADTVINGTCMAVGLRCKALDAIVANGNAFPALRRLSIYILVAIRDDPEFPETMLERQFRQAAMQVEKACFKKLQTISNLKFSFTLEMEWTLD
ncbi:hypothetical protein HYPSUDRAFT_67785 [Hypholoma sublateritium FD-334 SS-4]|uniref:Uncharacterized protein n=1 Tax=Hypholoma sublateritium (strain FD-334 SS-4) TaxID=945553 RepID=A0A0D2L3R7_HYPSF|nr:hypothetical protein HYPSUDRAFT_67785 [Hypholoma sublateritium FD-334 SS-4]